MLRNFYVDYLMSCCVKPQDSLVKRGREETIYVNSNKSLIIFFYKI